MRFLGIDGGGTKTAFSIFDEHMAKLGDSIVLETSHFAQVGYAGMKDVLKHGIYLCERTGVLGNDWGIGFGLAGYGQEKDVRTHIETAIAACVSEAAPLHPYELVNDVEAAHAAALGVADGIVVVAGTGSIAYGKNAEKSARCGGWGYQVGDEGSGWWIGRETVRIFSRQSDGRNARGPLRDIVIRELHLSEDAEIIGYMRDKVKNSRLETAKLSRLAYLAACAGDSDAIDIFRRAAYEDALLVRTLIEKLFSDETGRDQQKVPVSYVGGTFKAGRFLLNPLESSLPEECCLQAPKYDPGAGACLLLRARLLGGKEC